MKKGVNIWSFPQGTTIAESIRIAKDAGFEGIELSLNETGELSLEATEQEVRDIKSQLEQADLEICGLATGLYWSYSMTSESAANRTKAMDITRKQLELAASFGVDTILVIPGAVGVDFIPDSEVVDYERAYDRALECISTLSSDAKAAGVSIGIENVWNKFLLSPLELRTFIDTVNSDYVGSYFDVGNVVANGYPEQWVRILGNRIKKVHFKDYRRQAGGLHGFVDLLAGDVNYPAVVEALRAIDYNNYVIAEMIPGYTHHGEQIIYNTSRAMDAILGRGNN
ncbi:sugar phosphate isomerase/epimerase family protein [Paenibacillus lignilyticus]|uniref:Sugar phosphate isomerase/epimerase n=1 Tax=Paenibacillus lignilyticus TaxID=1172615 RepID=A0ABS5CLS9_9BACL|nr:sugar phosphate isomerase/epimerase family protein [Paenibacillus lignilyticus]MBP3966822.1 sugar phosphate isomerase/epimerase [Paenibacillus lignilyticus]